MKNKTIGILSMQRVANYGSFLQAWALRMMLFKAGADDVFFMDIRSGRQLKGYKTAKISVLLKKIAYVFRLLLAGKASEIFRSRSFSRRLRRKFAEEYHAMLGLDRPSPPRFDLAVIGSDEVFNCCQPSPWGYTRQLYGDIPEAASVATYAASFGSTTYGDLLRYGIAEDISTALSGVVNPVSVRDENSCGIIEKLTGRIPLKHADPVLVYDFGNEMRGLSSGMKNFMVVYSYLGRITYEEAEHIVRFARSKNLRIVSLMSRYHWCDEAVVPETPFHVIAFFRDADYIVTDTFHGTIFSVITRSNFCTLIRESNVQKLTSLLDDLGQRDRAAGSACMIGRILETPVDYAFTEQVIEKEKERTAEYLGRLVN